MPSSTQIYHLLSNHSKQPAIKRILKNHPELSPLYEAWALNQHLLTNAKAQERALLTALIDADIPSVLQPLLSIIYDTPFTQTEEMHALLLLRKAWPPPSPLPRTKSAE
jgi:hypothetical protein